MLHKHAIIGIAGRKGAGKDTVAELILDNLEDGTPTDLVRFASPLKAMVHVILAFQGVPEAVAVEMIEGAYKETPAPWLDGHSPRYVMQTLGTEWGRELIGDDFWVNIIRRHLEALPEPCVVVIPDVRFENEAKMIKEVGGLLIHIDRPGANDEDAHKSEAGVPSLLFDHSFQNSGTIEDLYDQVEPVLMDFLNQGEIAQVS